YLTAPRAAPFFLFLSFLEPHHQNNIDDYPAPAGYADRYRDRWRPADLVALGGTSERHYPGYCGMVKRLDEALGRICTALREQGQWDNTILLRTSDHGCHFKTRNAEYKRSCHESSIRVPTLLHGPGFLGGGARPEMVSVVDLPPTLLDAAGLPVPPEMQGRSLMPHLRGRGGDWPGEVFVQISEAENARAIRTPRWKYSVTAPATDAERARNEPWWPVYVEQALYDLDADPAELDNLIERDSHRATAAELRARLLQRMAAAGERVPMILPAGASNRL